jgi:hypothetical protein
MTTPHLEIVKAHIVASFLSTLLGAFLSTLLGAFLRKTSIVGLDTVCFPKRCQDVGYTCFLVIDFQNASSSAPNGVAICCGGRR